MIAHAEEGGEAGRVIDVTPDAIIFGKRGDGNVLVRKVNLDKSDYVTSCYNPTNHPYEHGFYGTVIDSLE